MRLSLTFQLILAFLFVSLAGTVFVAILAGRTTRTEFDNLFLETARNNFIEDVSAHYQTAGSWQGVEQAIRRLAQARSPQPSDEGEPLRPLPRPEQLPHFVLVGGGGRGIIPGPNFRLGEPVPPDLVEQGTPIEIDGQVVGTVLSADANPQPLGPEGLDILNRINNALLYAALGATIIALVLGVFLARTLTRPLRELTVATKQMARGDLEQRVPVRTRDELGQLAASFNQMSTDLARSNQLRRQMTADIAHDLRTPLAVIAGYIESLRDGIFQPTPDMFDVMYSEAQHLQRLVEDLRTLSLADANELPLHREPVDVEELLNRLAAAHGPQADQQHVILGVDANANLPAINVDPERINQVLGNLVRNAFRYTPENGRSF